MDTFAVDAFATSAFYAADPFDRRRGTRTVRSWSTVMLFGVVAVVAILGLAAAVLHSDAASVFNDTAEISGL